MTASKKLIPNMQKWLGLFLAFFKPRNTQGNNAAHVADRPSLVLVPSSSYIESNSLPREEAGTSASSATSSNSMDRAGTSANSEGLSSSMTAQLTSMNGLNFDETSFPPNLRLRPEKHHQKSQPKNIRKMMVPQQDAAAMEIPPEELVEAPDVLELDNAHAWDDVQLDNLDDNVENIVMRLPRENGQLLYWLDGGRHTIYTYFGSIDRLDVVKEVFRYSMTTQELADVATVNLRTPASDGRTCLCWFAHWCNLEGVKFCVSLFGGPSEGWLAAILAVLTAAGYHRRNPAPRDYVQFLRAVLRAMAQALQGSFAACLNNQMPEQEWSRLCPWVSPHAAVPRLLHFACMYCDLPFVELLLQAGANPTLMVPAPGGQTNCYDLCAQFQDDPVASARQLCAACQAAGWDCTGGAGRLMVWLQQHRQIQFDDPHLFHRRLHENHES